jgi:hypothetical protein
MRLIALIPYIAICLIGMVVSNSVTLIGVRGKSWPTLKISAVGMQRRWPWQAIVVIGYGFVGIQVVAIPAIVISVRHFSHHGKDV